MNEVIVGSSNPVKLEVAKKAFEDVFPEVLFTFQSFNANSEVKDQPIGREETLKGAYNRIENCKKSFPNADYWVAQESGVLEVGEKMFEISYIVIASKTQMSEAMAGSFQIPKDVAIQLRQGKELGPVSDQFFGVSNSKQQASIIGLLTNGLIGRTQVYYQAAVFALMPHKHPKWY